MNVARPPSILLLAAGFVIWSSAFVLLYGVQSVSCAFGWHRDLVANVSLGRALLLATWAAHVAALVGLLIHCRRLPVADDGVASFLRTAAIGLTTAALVATIWTGVAIPAVSRCI